MLRSCRNRRHRRSPPSEGSPATVAVAIAAAAAAPAARVGCAVRCGTAVCIKVAKRTKRPARLWSPFVLVVSKGCKPLGEAKTKAPNFDYHKLEPPVAARQAEVARDYLKRAARIDELNGHPPGSDGQMVTALKRYNGGRVLVFVMGAFAEMSEVVSRICGIIAHDLAQTHVSYYNDDAKRTKGKYRKRIQKAWGHTAHRGWARLLLDSLIAPGTSSSTARRTAARTAWRCRRTRTTRTCYCCLDPIPPTDGGGVNVF